MCTKTGDQISPYIFLSLPRMTSSLDAEEAATRASKCSNQEKMGIFYIFDYLMCLIAWVWMLTIANYLKSLLQNNKKTSGVLLGGRDSKVSGLRSRDQIS